MKNYFNLIIGFIMLFVVACETVPPGHKGVEVSWGGETNMNVVHPEGLASGINWLFDDMIVYDVREHTVVQTFEFNDKNDMITQVEVALDYNLIPSSVNRLHVGINDVDTKIITSLSSAAKEVVPQYSAVDLNKHKRTEGERLLSAILSKELPEFYVEFKRVRFTDVNIPNGISKLAEQTAVQLGKNELAEKMEAEQVALAKANIAKAEGVATAKVATAQGNYDAGILDAKTKKLLSTTAILKLKELEVEMTWARQGKSRYGSNNMFGAETALVKGLK